MKSDISNKILRSIWFIHIINAGALALNIWGIVRTHSLINGIAAGFIIGIWLSVIIYTPMLDSLNKDYFDLMRQCIASDIERLKSLKRMNGE